MKMVKKIKMKIVIFTAVKNRCILHGRVFVMEQTGPTVEKWLQKRQIEYQALQLT